jgi:hypothetical protein
LFVLTERSESAKPRRLLLFPLVVYYTMTLGVPLLNASYHQGSTFWEYFVFVLVLPLILFVPFELFCGCWDKVIDEVAKELGHEKAPEVQK